MLRIQGMSVSCAFGCSLALGMVMQPASVQAGGYQQLWSFQGSADADGSSPFHGLLSYKGNFYGSTAGGGTYGAGTIYELLSQGGETLLYSFTGGSDGASPGGPPVVDSKGNLYDAAFVGGSGGCSGGCGTVFKLTPNGTFTLLYTFQGGNDGDQPWAGVTMDTKGNLYGTTAFGGGGSCSFSGNPPGCGTVFEITPKGEEKVLYAFKGGADGAEPYSNLVVDSSGNFYGTTSYGGTGSCSYSGQPPGCGTVFKLAPDGKETVLYSFCSQSNCSDGAVPFFVTPIMDKGGNLYGTTQFGGGNCELSCGTVFKLAPDGTETVLYSFCSQSKCSDGRRPWAGVISDRKGNLYGTALYGGDTGCKGLGCGTVFKLAPDGTETVLHTFAGKNDGANPVAPLIAVSGNLYGVATAGGGSKNCKGGCGNAFEVKE
jgi:uncharacterized repeat protein (TIGR03803 family)